MNIVADDLFELDGSDYITVDAYDYNSEHYIFANKLNGEEPTKEFVVFKCSSDGLEEEKDEFILKVVLGVFSENMNKKLETINESFIKNEEWFYDGKFKYRFIKIS